MVLMEACLLGLLRSPRQLRPRGASSVPGPQSQPVTCAAFCRGLSCPVQPAASAQRLWPLVPLGLPWRRDPTLTHQFLYSGNCPALARQVRSPMPPDPPPETRLSRLAAARRHPAPGGARGAREDAARPTRKPVGPGNTAQTGAPNPGP